MLQKTKVSKEKKTSSLLGALLNVDWYNVTNAQQKVKAENETWRVQNSNASLADRMYPNMRKKPVEQELYGELSKSIMNEFKNKTNEIIARGVHANQQGQNSSSSTNARQVTTNTQNNGEYISHARNGVNSPNNQIRQDTHSVYLPLIDRNHTGKDVSNKTIFSNPLINKNHDGKKIIDRTTITQALENRNNTGEGIMGIPSITQPLLNQGFHGNRLPKQMSTDKKNNYPGILGFSGHDLAPYINSGKYYKDFNEDEKVSFVQAIEHGLETSILGLMYHQKMADTFTPEQIANMSSTNKVLLQLAQIAGDSPTLFLGTAAGATTGPGAIMASPAAAIGLTEGYRTYLHQLIKDDKINIAGIGTSTLIGASAGASAGVFGKFASTLAKSLPPNIKGNLRAIIEEMAPILAESFAAPVVNGILQGKSATGEEIKNWITINTALKFVKN